MTFNHATNTQTIVRDTKFWCGIASTNTTSYPLADITRNSNAAMDWVQSLIMKADSSWKWQDANNSTLPIGTKSLVSSQYDYGIATSHLKILEVRIKDRNGEWVTLSPKNRNEMTDSEKTESGTPRIYSKVGNWIFLSPTPDYASSNGLEIRFQTGISYFTYTDDTTYDTTTPGFATQFHRIISLRAALDYCEANGLDKRVVRIQNKLNVMEAELTDFYSQREGDQKVSLKLSSSEYGEGYDVGGTSSNVDGFDA